MRFNFLFIFFLSLFSFGQSERDLLVVDSIRNSVSDFKLNDSIKLGVAHYKIGEIYRYAQSNDSAYFYYLTAEKVFRNLKSKFQLAKTLYGISSIQSDEKVYTEAEVTSIEAISLLESINNSDDVNKYKSFVYNNLGINFNELEQFDESIRYHEKSLEIRRGLDDKNRIDNSLNNIGFVYKNLKQYNLALDYFNQILENLNLIKERPGFYALVLDNYAYTLYLSKNHEQLPKLYFEALKVIDSINPGGYNSIIINQHLAEYYNDKGQKDSAKYYAYNAKNIAQTYHNDDLLKSLLLLSKIEDGYKAATHLNEYIILSDSLQKRERQTRNKFARIRFDSDQLEKDNIKMIRERTWLIIISVILIIALLLIYIIINQRNKNNKLRFIQQQQEANEEIYNLMLSQHDNIEEARALEKKRISQELHDGVLGRLFGTRLSLDSLNMSTTAEAINSRSQYIIELKTIEDEIRKVSHELNTDFILGSGFIDIIKTLVDNQTKVYGIDYELKHNDDINWEEASNKTKIHIYRIIQEALQNIYKHANASLIKINFEMKKNIFRLSIRDNGSGFDINKPKKGIGLKNITSRVNEIKGNLTIHSELNKGTTLIIDVNTD